MSPQAFFDTLWQQYTEKTPQAQRIHDLFTGRGEVVINDHVAFRTFDCPKIGISALEPHLLALGYHAFDDYEFPAKHLVARAYLHSDGSLPKVFLSALSRGVLSTEAESLLNSLVAQVPGGVAADPGVFSAGRMWQPPSLTEYELLASESEYAAWLAIHGLCANHFTVSVNHLQGFGGIESVLAAVKEAGFALNASGGEIKGAPQDLLMQGATLADRQQMAFRCGNRAEVPTCYYEFAERFADQSGVLYQGFLAANADKIFESTHRQR